MEQDMDAGESRIYIKLIGRGEPLVFLHGGPGSEHHYFLPQMEELADHFELVFYDQTGCGKSDPVNEYSMEKEIEVLEKVRRELGFEKIHLFGESWGLCLLWCMHLPIRNVSGGFY
ncbi:alpha/beta fold hydrolase [Halobacillus litoralis]|uniref:alpha/beta fold hydrolase n=1 Tax=Halobacillus litoralis TaxID=45668 RepID=UPI001CFD3892|nr:alpha/beta fold hydrolase [Halobacillus litoralis]